MQYVVFFLYIYHYPPPPINLSFRIVKKVSVYLRTVFNLPAWPCVFRGRRHSWTISLEIYLIVHKSFELIFSSKIHTPNVCKNYEILTFLFKIHNTILTAIQSNFLLLINMLPIVIFAVQWSQMTPLIRTYKILAFLFKSNNILTAIQKNIFFKINMLQIVIFAVL